MEEVVGEFWHRLVTKHASTEYDDVRVNLDDIQSQLGPFYRALGGCSAKVIEAAAPRKFNADRNFLQRLAGTHKRLCVAWQDERSVRLAPNVAFFQNKELNEKLYFWQVAMAAYLPIVSQWFVDNQRASLAIIKARPGLKLIYHELVEEVLSLRPSLNKLEGAKHAREVAIRHALKEPGSVDVLPKAAGDAFPVPLWLYPDALQGMASLPLDDGDEELAASRSGLQKVKSARREAQRTNDAKKTDGLLVFMLESIFSWTEHVNLDRPQRENDDEELQSAAEDLDVITLSRQRRAGAARLKFDLDLPAPQNDDLAIGDGIKFPEWDYRKSSYIEDFCLLQPMLTDDAEPQGVPDSLKSTVNQVRKRFSALQFQQNWLRRQPFGSELDLDACVEWMTEASQSDNQNLYKKRCLNERDISCLLLADLSMSTDAGINADQRVIDVIRDSILVFSEALLEAGDPFAIYGFSSIKNKQVRFHLVKNFAEQYGDGIRGRILAIKPGFYTRMGASIRQATQILEQQASQQRLLLIISDGKPNDIDHYEGRYGIEDTRKAILEAKQLGLQPFCITIDEEGSDYLPYLFGDQGFSVIKDITRLPSLLPKLYLNLTGLQ
jgi:nitric oxide reductase NorD protein